MLDPIENMKVKDGKLEELAKVARRLEEEKKELVKEYNDNEKLKVKEHN